MCARVSRHNHRSYHGCESNYLRLIFYCCCYIIMLKWLLNNNNTFISCEFSVFCLHNIVNPVTRPFDPAFNIPPLSARRGWARVIIHWIFFSGQYGETFLLLFFHGRPFCYVFLFMGGRVPFHHVGSILLLFSPYSKKCCLFSRGGRRPFPAPF